MYRVFRSLILSIAICAAQYPLMEYVRAAPGFDSVQILDIEEVKNLDADQIRSCKIRVGDGCGSLDQTEIMECVEELAKCNPISLDLSQTYLSIDQVKKVIQLCPDLMEFDYSHNGLNCEEVSQFCCSINQNSKSLRVLKMQYNDLKSDGVIQFAEMLKSNHTIEDLDLSGNICWAQGVHESGDPAAKALAEALIVNRTLLVLKIMSNEISSKEGIWSFCDNKIALKKDGQTREIDVSNNSLGNDSEKHSALNIVRSINSNLVLIYE